MKRPKNGTTRICLLQFICFLWFLAWNTRTMSRQWPKIRPKNVFEKLALFLSSWFYVLVILELDSNQTPGLDRLLSYDVLIMILRINKLGVKKVDKIARTRGRGGNGRKYKWFRHDSGKGDSNNLIIGTYVNWRLGPYTPRPPPPPPLPPLIPLILSSHPAKLAPELTKTNWQKCVWKEKKKMKNVSKKCFPQFWPRTDSDY